VVGRPHLNAVQYRFALAQAQTAHRAASGDPRYSRTLGAAQYRSGRYREADAILTGPAAGPRGDPAAVALLALTREQLGRHEEAARAVVRARELLSSSGLEGDGDLEALVGEAEALVGRKRPGPN